jgi:hypothetical protein
MRDTKDTNDMAQEVLPASYRMQVRVQSLAIKCEICGRQLALE